VAAGTHVPWLQPEPGSQGRPHCPQWALSIAVSVLEFAQAVWPGRQASEQTPAEQAVVPVQVTPQSPQLFGSTLVGMHWPPQNER
jgi:hypothetical protein